MSNERSNPILEQVWKHMTKGRYLELSKTGGPLTEEERKDWHFCYDWDYLLIHREDPTFEGCHCGFKDNKAWHYNRPEKSASKP